MAKDRLAIQEDRYDYKIGWYLWDDEEFGLMLGRGTDSIEDAAETVAATKAIRANTELHPLNLDSTEWCWENRSTAQKALRVAKAAIATMNAAKPMPEWAIKATAEGWKPPKGWKP